VRWLSIFPGVLSLALALPVYAQAGGNKAAAEALFVQGRNLMAAERFDEACPKFEASLKLDEGLGTRLHLADCYERSDKIASAWALFKEVESMAKVKNDPERGQISRVRAAALEPRLMRLVIEVPADLPGGFELTRNGEPVLPELYNTATPVDPGTWTVRATAPGYEPFEASISLTQQRSKPFSVEIPALTPLPEAAAPTPEPPPTQQDAMTDTAPSVANGGRTQRITGLIVAGVGVVAGIVSIVFTVRASQKNSDSQSDCDGNNDCGNAGFAARNDAFDFANIATGAGILGVVGIGAGTALYLTAPSDGSSADLQPHNAPRSATLGLWWERPW
jgi:hypothetical protein